MKTAAIVAWSGYGEFNDLESSASAKLGRGVGSITRGPNSLTVSHADPLGVARKLAHLPGVDWIAVGFGFDSRAGLAAGLNLLAKRYVHPGSSFRLTAKAEDSADEEGDILLDGIGLVLKSGKGKRVDEKNPDVTLRIVMVKDKGAVGVELKKGPGGVPTSKSAKASCLVSGGYHSAVMAWMAALSGFSLTLVHSRDDDESLRQVGRLYAELSSRLDPTSIKLEVLEGTANAGDRLATWLDGASGDIMAGVHPGCRGKHSREVLRRYPAVVMPLLLLQEDEVRAKLQSLGIKVKGGDGSPALSIRGKAPYSVRRFGGKESDVNGVLDGLR